jgi:YXWGXW repeat-containing protein/sporulation related protein
MTPGCRLAFSLGCSALLCVGSWPSTPAQAQVLERGIEGAAVGAIIGGIVGGGKGAAAGAGIGAGIGALSGAAEGNAGAQGYYGPPPGYGPPPPGYYGPPPRYGSRGNGHYGAPNPAYPAPPRRDLVASIGIAPPPLPVYDQPLCPGPGYLWTPGYWAYAAGDYYWVPGTWVLPPAVGLVWTPGYWGYEGQRYVWHAGYWGPHVGYYGGINYGLGYFGSGYEGGHWENGLFFYNTAVTRVDTTVITNTYDKQVISTATANNVGFNGPAGITAQPTAQEVAWSRERHTPPTALQVTHQRTARANRALFAAVNQGTPTVAATAKPGVFKGPEIVGPKAVAMTNAPVITGSTVPGKFLSHGQTGIAPGASGEAGPEAGQHAPVGQHGPSAAANGGVASNTAKHALSGPSDPSGTVASGGPAPGTGQQAPAGPHNIASKSPGSSSGPQGNASVAPNLAGPTAGANEGSEANPTATADPTPKASAIPPPATSSISGDKPLSTTSSATSAGSSGTSSKSPTPAASSEGPTQTANLEPTNNIPPGTTRFGIEIGTVEKQAGVQRLWRDMRANHAALVAGLQPRRMLAPDKKWQLIAGPFASTAEATQVCVLFKKENLKCEATVFAGEEL